MSDSVQPHRRQPTRLRSPRDSTGKNTGVGCHFLLQCMKMKSESEVTQSRPHGLQPTRLLRPWDLSGKCTGVGCLFRDCILTPLKSVFPAQTPVLSLRIKFQWFLNTSMALTGFGEEFCISFFQDQHSLVCLYHYIHLICVS